MHAENSKLSTAVKDVILASWKDSTKSQYETYLKQWDAYCLHRFKHPITADYSVALEFLNALRQKGLSYSAINTARSALSTIMKADEHGCDFGSHKLVVRFMKGVFNARPSLPRYASIWDPDTVLNFLSRMAPRKTLTLKGLTIKTAALLALLTAQRVQTLHLIKISNVSFTEDHVQIIIDDLLKTSRPNWHLEPIVFKKFNVCKSLCILRYLRTYISKTRKLRGDEDQLFVSYTKPHKAVVKSTIARWIRDVLHRAGVDVAMYKAHSTRAAASSKAVQYLPIEKILKAGGWSSSSSFIKHYNLPVAGPASSNVLLLE